MLYALSELLPEMVGVYNFPCGLQAFLFLCIVPSIGSMQVCRNTYFLIITKFSRVLYFYGKPQDLLDHTDGTITHRKQSLLWKMKVIFYGFSLLLNPPKILTEQISKEDAIRTLISLKYLTRNQAIVFMFFIVSFPFFFAAFLIVVLTPPYLHCTGCRRTDFLTYIAFGMAIWFVSTGLYVAVRARHLPDVFGVLREGRLSLAWTLIAFLGYILVVAVPIPENFVYDNELLIFIGMSGALFSVSVWQVYLAYQQERMLISQSQRPSNKRIEQSVSSYNPVASVSLQKQGSFSIGSNISSSFSNNNHNSISQNTGNNSNSPNGNNNNTRRTSNLNFIDEKLYPNLASLLKDTVVFDKFQEFLMMEYTQEALFFLLDSFEWKNTFYDVTPSARFVRAKRLYSMYIDPHGLYAINISNYRQIQEVLKGLKEETLEPTLFDKARDEITKLLETGSVSRFRNSPVFKDFLTGRHIIALVDREGSA